MKVVDGAAPVARRRKLTAGIVTGALVVTATIVVLTYWRNRVREEKAVRPLPSLPSNVHQQLSGYSFTRSDGGRQIFTVHAARTVAFKQGGTTVLEDVYVEVFGQTGNRRDILRTRRCDYNTESGDLFSSGTVQMELNAPANEKARGGPEQQRSVMLETSKLYFEQQGSLLTSDEPVRYRIGPVSGTARGMSYSTKEGWLELKEDVNAEMSLKGGSAPQLPVRLTAARARYEKQKGEVRLGGPVEIGQGNRRVQAGSALITLDNRNRVVRALLEDDVQAFGHSENAQLGGSAHRVRGDFDPVSEQLRTVFAEGDVKLDSKRAGENSHLAAQQVGVNFAGEHSEAQSGMASGSVHLSVETSAGAAEQLASANLGAEKKDLTAGGLRFSFQSRGQSLKDADTVGAGRLVLAPSNPKAGERVITAGQFLMGFDQRSRLETLRGVSGSRIVFQPPKSAPAGSLAQESSADRLEAAFDPVTQTIRTVQQFGDFQFREGDRRATAEQASYQAQTNSLVLTGRPEFRDPEMRTRADRVLLNLGTDTAEGVGKVQSTHLGGFAGNGVTNVLADRVVAQRRSQTVHYKGNVRAWHGTDVIESAALDVYRNERRVSSGYRVCTSHLQPSSFVGRNGAKSETKGGTSPATIRADHLEYFDEGRKASYRGSVRFQTENTTLEADRLDAYFSGAPGAEDTELERAVADGHVRMTQPARRATGNHAEYFAQDGRMLLIGGPPTLYDVDKGFTTGQRLTFFLHDDRLLVDGGDESPTVSKHRIAQ